VEGYEVKTVDDEKIGKVVGTSGKYLIVEQGMLRKSKHALPREFAVVDESEQLVRMTVTKDVFCDSPKIENGSLDERAIAEYYGLTSPTAIDPAGNAEDDAARAGIETAPEERLRTRSEMESGDSGLPRESPALLGDRVSGIDEREQEKR
jgi:hypothetical protein